MPTHYLTEESEVHRTFHPSRLMGLYDMTNADSLIDLITELGVPKNKILISVPASAYEFILRNPKNNTPRSLTYDENPIAINRKHVCTFIKL